MSDADLLLSLLGTTSQHTAIRPATSESKNKNVNRSSTGPSINVDVHGRDDTSDMCGFTKLDVIDRKSDQRALAAEFKTLSIIFQDIRIVHTRQAQATSSIAIAGVIAEKRTSTTRKGGYYSFWRLSNLEGESITVCLFDYAHITHEKEPIGTIVVISRPRIDKVKSSNKSSLSIETVDQICIIGTAKHFGYCMADKKDGTPCSMPVNRAKTNYCQYHITLALKRPRPALSAAAPEQQQQPYNSLESSTDFFASSAVPSSVVSNHKSTNHHRATLSAATTTTAVLSASSAATMSLRRVVEQSQQRRLLATASIPAKDSRFIASSNTIRQAISAIATPQTKAHINTSNSGAFNNNMKLSPATNTERVVRRGVLQEILGDSRRNCSQNTDHNKGNSSSSSLVGTTTSSVHNGSVIVPQASGIFVRTPTPATNTRASISIPATHNPSDSMITPTTSLIALTPVAASVSNKRINTLSSAADKTAQPVKRIKRIEYSVNFDLSKLPKPGSIATSTKHTASQSNARGKVVSTANAFDQFFQPSSLSVQEVLESTSVYETEADEEWFQSFDKKAKQLEKREYAAEQAAKQKSLNVKAFYCVECQNVQEFIVSYCRSHSHTIKRVTVLKRFFECRVCKTRKATLCRKLPTQVCPSCGSDQWQATGRSGSTHDSNILTEKLILTSADLSGQSEFSAR